MVLYAWVKVHSHASHTPLSCTLSEISHASQAGMCSLCCMSHILNQLKLPIYSNFVGASCYPCALCFLCHRSQQLLCIMCCVSHIRCLMHLYPCVQYLQDQQWSQEGGSATEAGWTYPRLHQRHHQYQQVHPFLYPEIKCSTSSVAKAQAIGQAHPHILFQFDAAYLLHLACHKPTSGKL
jgi:hypothetical protein